MDKRPSITGIGSEQQQHRRRSSVMFQGITPWESGRKGIRRGSRMGLSISEGTESAVRAMPSIKLENTYRLEPGNNDRFFANKVEDIIQSNFEKHLDNTEYSASECSQQCKTLSSHIKQDVKKLGFKRHKVVCQVMIGEMKDQGFQIASRALWDSKFDNYACVEYCNAKLFAVGMVHGVYFE